jgi:Cu(I)/Ag(I) efflux system membrane protein CusA/SilA
MQRVIQTALGGMQLDEVVEGRQRYAMMVRYDRPYRAHVDDLKNILISSPSGAFIPLSDLADIRINEGPSMIKSENARLNGWVFVDIEERDLASYVQDLRKKLKTLELPQGTSLSLSGEYEKMQEARARLSLTIPATLLLIITLLYAHFKRLDRMLMILLALPFGIIGGIWGLWIAGYNLSVAVAVGFIALAGIAIETAIVMMIYLDQQMREYPPENEQDLRNNVMIGAVQRLRPKLMTVLTIIFGLLPIFLSIGPGSDVMRRIALPMLSGMVSTMVLTLILLPVIYILYMQRQTKFLP